jgi:hypothetical protein
MLIIEHHLIHTQCSQILTPLMATAHTTEVFTLSRLINTMAFTGLKVSVLFGYKSALVGLSVNLTSAYSHENFVKEDSV